MFPKIIKENNCLIEKCSRRFDICKNILVVSTEFTCHATKRKYKIRGTLTCNTKNIIYLITCKSCRKQYIGSATGFKERFRIHKSDINTGKVRCGVANHLLNVCKSAICKTEYLHLPRFYGKEKNIGRRNSGLNSISEWYAINRRGYRK